MTVKPKILVTSAAGHVGRPVVLQLRQLGYPVRAFVRRRDVRSVELEQAGAEIFVGDIRDFRDLRAALTGVHRAFHCPPYSMHTLYDAMLFAVAAEEAKLEVVALLGAFNIHPVHSSIVQRGHWIANQSYRWMPTVDVIHIGPGLFAYPYFLGLPAIVHFGQLILPFGEGLNAPPSNEDIARVASSVLTSPAEHVGKSYRPTGPNLIAPHEVAEVFGQILGRRVTYKDVPFRSFQKAAQAMGFPLEEIAHLRYYAEEVRNNVYGIGAPTDHVERITGQPPESFGETAARYLKHPELVAQELDAGTLFSAIRMLFRMIMTQPANLDVWERDRGYPMLKSPLLAHESQEWRAFAKQGELFLLPDDQQSPTANAA